MKTLSTWFYHFNKSSWSWIVSLTVGASMAFLLPIRYLPYAWITWFLLYGLGGTYLINYYFKHLYEK